MVGRSHALPGNDGLRRVPTQITYRRRCVRYAAIQAHAIGPLDGLRACDLTTIYSDRLLDAGNCQPNRGKKTAQDAIHFKSLLYTLGNAKPSAVANATKS
jgi:hypothetical protein